MKSRLTSSEIGRAERRAAALILGTIVFIVAITTFAFRLGSETRFVDESAFLSQSYFFDLARSGQRNDPKWIDYPAYDLPPLPKYLIGGALRIARLEVPDSRMAIAWYANTRTVVGDASQLMAGRIPSVLFGAIGCTALFAMGSMAFGNREGIMAALLLIANPLYRLHARRAMADVPAEALILVTLVLGMVIWRRLQAADRRRPWYVLSLAAGLAGGFAVLAKLNGGLGLMILAGWTVLGIVLKPVPAGRTVKGIVSLTLSTAIALLAFVVLNPFVLSRPLTPLPASLIAPAPPSQSVPERLRAVIDHRVAVSLRGQDQFPNDATRTPAEKAKAMAVQGFGRFGPFGPSHSDSTRRYDGVQDLGATLWIPLVLGGLILASLRGYQQMRRSQPATAWLVIVQFVMAIGVVGAFLPLAWDRYFLSIQPACCLLGGLAIVAILEGIGRSIRGRGPAFAVFLILFASYAFFWHGRDWNVSSRLMLVYALADRGTVQINGLEDHTHDRARLGDVDHPRFYSDKQPGFSFLALPAYVAAKVALGLPDHPVDRKGVGFTHWPADYWITLGTSGFLTALLGAILSRLAGDLGCGPRRSAVVGLSYGLATPAYAYATLGYGHQSTALLLLGSFAAIREAARTPHARSLCALAGLMAAWASITEIQVGPVSAILGFYLIAMAIRRRIPISAVLAFALGAAVPTAMLLSYNTIAFGSPFDMGYFHEDLQLFKDVHSNANPLGLRGIDWNRTPDLLWEEHRGLLVYAPILILAPVGWVVQAVRKQWDVLIVSIASCVAVFVVNLSYPNWNGGMSTGPRLLLPMIPFAMLGVASAMGLRSRFVTAVAVVLALVGASVMILFQASGARIPPASDNPREVTVFNHPVREVAWPIWKGDPLPRWREGGRFDRTVLSWKGTGRFDNLPPSWQWTLFLPLMIVQATAIGSLLYATRPRIPPNPGLLPPVRIGR